MNIDRNMLLKIVVEAVRMVLLVQHYIHILALVREAPFGFEDVLAKVRFQLKWMKPQPVEHNIVAIVDAIVLVERHL